MRTALLFFLVLGACAGAQPGRSAGLNCSSDNQCALVEVSCCPPCGAWTAEMYEAVPASQADAVRHERCPEPTTCPACASLAPDPAIVAACREGQCAVVRH